MFRRVASRMCAAAPKASAAINSAPGASPAASVAAVPVRRRHRWLRRLGWTTGILGGAYVVTDLATDSSLTRSLRTVISFFHVAATYKFTSPDTPEAYHELNKWAAGKILYVCVKNEGLYIKLGQALNAMSHILPPEYTETLRILLDRAPPVPMPLVEKTILQATGASSLKDIFVDFEEAPIASASIAQVHRAWVRTDALTWDASAPGQSPAKRSSPTPIGDDAPVVMSGLRDRRDPRNGVTMVAVKVRKPNIDKQAVWDVRTYQFISYLMERWFGLPTGWARQTIVDALYREMDFTIEEQNAVTMRRFFAERSKLPVYVPYVFRNWTSPSLLVMEWIDGTKVANVEEVRREYADPSAIIKTVFDAFGDMVFRDSFVHCDPHGANILVRPRGRHLGAEEEPTATASASASAPAKGKVKDFEVVFLDFGMCAPVTEKFRMEYALFLRSIFTGDMKLLQDVVTGWGIGNSEMFASMQMQKPLSSMRRGEYGEITKEEVHRMQREAHTKIKAFLVEEGKMPKELPLVLRGFDLLRGINRLYGSPVNRLNMLMQRAMWCLGPLHDYAGVQAYLARLEARRREKTAQADGSRAPDGGAASAKDQGIRSVYDATATRLREEQEAAARELTASQTWFERLETFFGSLYRMMVFRMVLFNVQLLHTVTYWYNRMMDALGAAPESHLTTLEDRVEKVAQSIIMSGITHKESLRGHERIKRRRVDLSVLTDATTTATTAEEPEKTEASMTTSTSAALRPQSTGEKRQRDPSVSRSNSNSSSDDDDDDLEAIQREQERLAQLREQRERRTAGENASGHARSGNGGGEANNSSTPGDAQAYDSDVLFRRSDWRGTRQTTVQKRADQWSAVTNNTQSSSTYKQSMRRFFK